MSPSRKLAAIAFIDVVGYSSMMAKDERSALRLLEELRKVLYPLVRRYNGNVLKELGDGALVSFESALEATRCAMTLQDEVKDVPNLKLRIGIHLGDVVVEKKDVFGTGVNIAAHIQPLAAPGGVVVTEDVWKQMKNQPSFSFISLGLRRLKGIHTAAKVFAVKGEGLALPGIKVRVLSHPNFIRGTIASLLLALSVFFYFSVFKTQEASLPEVPSIAVLYLKNLGPETDEPYSYGITQDLIVDLAKAGPVRVAPMKDVLAIRGIELPIEKVAERLGVGFVVEGTLRRETEMFTLTARILEAGTGKILWTDDFRTSVSEAAALQGKLAAKILAVLDLKPAPAVARDIVRTRTPNAEAYELYLRGKYFFETKKGTDDIAEARILYKQAISLDSSFVAARIGLGQTFDMQGEYGLAEEEYKNALFIAQSGGEKSDEARCLWRLGIIRDDVSDYPKALDYFERSLVIFEELGDRNGQARVLNSLGIVYRSLGEYITSLDYLTQSLRIKQELADKRGEATTLANIGNIHFDRGDYAQALDYFEGGLKISRGLGDRQSEGGMLTNIGSVHQALGEYGKALNLFEQDLNITRELGDRKGEGMTLHNIGSAYSIQGDSAKALDYLTRSLRICREVGDRSTEAHAIQNLGILLLDRGNFRGSVDSLKKSTRIFGEIGEKHHLILATSHLALAEAMAGHRSRADTNALRVEELITAEGKPAEYVLVLWNMFRVYSLLGNEGKSARFLERAYNAIQANSRNISDPAMREGYLLRAKHHREIIAAWEKLQKSPANKKKGPSFET